MVTASHEVPAPALVGVRAWAVRVVDTFDLLWAVGHGRI